MKLIIIFLIGGLAIFILLKSIIAHFSKRNKGNIDDEVDPINLIGHERVKLIPYKEALEASKQFIYNIAKIVMERFSTTAKEELMMLGKKLVAAGMQYFHVVDVFSLSLQKQVSKKKEALQKNNQKKKSIFGKTS